jgi:hypothetical protein
LCCCDGEKKGRFGTHENLQGRQKAMSIKKPKKAIKFEYLIRKIRTNWIVMESGGAGRYRYKQARGVR